MKRIILISFFILAAFSIFSQKIQYRIMSKHQKVKITCEHVTDDSVCVKVSVINYSLTPIYYIEEGISFGICYPLLKKCIGFRDIWDFGELPKYKLKKLSFLNKISISKKIYCKKTSDCFLSGNFLYFTSDFHKDNDSIYGVHIPIHINSIGFDSAFVNTKSKSFKVEFSGNHYYQK